ncbi:unnamed protein product [Linum trigynum]
MGDKAIPDRASTTTSPFPFFPNFHLDFPNPFRRETQQPRRQIVASDDPTPAAAAADKPDAIKFAERKPSSTAPPLQLEVDEPSHPLLTYSVYALGGFIVLKWVWARWNERKERANKGSSTEENRSPEYHSPAEGED